MVVCVRRFVLPRKQSVRNDMLQISNVQSAPEISTGNFFDLRHTSYIQLGRYRGVADMAHARTELTHISDRPYITKLNICPRK